MILAIDKLSSRFGDFALRDIALEIDQGEYWVLLGPSGCGKSLLLHTIAGFHPPDSGTLLLAGRDTTREPPEKRSIGLVFQQGALFPHMSVSANIGYGLRARRVAVAEREQRVEEIVSALGLERIVTRPVATLSGGEAQRVAVARALAIRPALLLLDEPLSLIDHNARLALREVLARVHQDFGLTTLHVTHSREEARAMGDHLAVMLEGHIVQRGPTEELFEAPACSFVADFLGIDSAACRESVGEEASSPRCRQSCGVRELCGSRSEAEE